MKKNKRLRSRLAGFLVFCLLVCLSACGRASSNQGYADREEYDGNGSEMALKEDTGIYGDSKDMDQADEPKEYDEDSAMAGAAADTEAETAQSMANASDDLRKLIRTVQVLAETKRFDEAMLSVQKQTDFYKGYTESSEIDGKEEEGNRSACLVIRIPSKELDAFLKKVEKGITITSVSENTEDVTLQYVDVESHLKALRTEQKSLLRLLEKAEKLSDILKIQEQLTNVRYEIESYDSQIRMLDNQIDYSTVTFYLTEVDRITETPGQKSFFSEAKAGLQESLYQIQESSRGFAIGLIACSPYLAMGAVFLVILILIIKKACKPFQGRKRNKREENKENETENREEDESIVGTEDETIDETENGTEDELKDETGNSEEDESEDETGNSEGDESENK